jgi:DNA-binding NarL/FixJ family response regulator
MISILLVEDHAVFAGVLVRLLSQTRDMEIVKVARTAEGALEELPQQAFDLVLVDVALPEMNGISLVALLRDQYPELPCLMLSGHSLAHYVKRALRAGARGYVLKDNGQEIVRSIRQVLRGDIYVSEELRER